MVDAIVALAVQKLDDFLRDKVGLLQGGREDVEWLREELGWMKCFIKDAQANKGGDNRVQKWISDINDVAYETMDVLETFSLKVEGDEAPKCRILDHLKAWANIPEKTDLYNIKKEIKLLKEKLQEISRRRKAYGLRNIGDGGQRTSAGSNNKLMRPLRRTTSYIQEDHVVVGIEDEANKLLAELLKEEPRRCVVSIYGMGGLGKTTLAQKLYNSHKVRGKFDCQAWVCVSQEYKIEDLLRSIIKSFKRLTREEFEMVERMTEEDLERHLHDFLKGCKYLVVLDDVWDKEAWKILRKAFPSSNNGSRVVITTCNKAVARSARDKTFAHKLRFLTTEESWDLFYKKAFPAGDGEVSCYCSPAKEELGREMVRKCAGLPLAIIVLGGLLLHKKQLEGWYKVKEHIWRHLRNDSIEISQLLSLSYNDLSSQLKPCFLYLGMFPEDYEIHARKLMFLWIAEEFIPQEEGIRIEDVVEEYMNELINRSLIQVTERSRHRRIIGCKVHDLLRDLAVHMGREENFFDIYDPRKPRSAPLLSRRHAVHSHVMSYFSLDHISNSRLRSLLFFNLDGESLESIHLKLICTNFKSLRVLDLESVTFPTESQLPDMIGEVVHLKFLGLSHTDISKLPPSIGNIKCLQFLAVGDFACTLPDEICKLKQLRHITAKFKGHLKVETLTNLQSLRYVEYEQWLEIDTVKLINLRNLGLQIFSKLENSTYSLESVAKLKCLEELCLHSSSNEELPSLLPLSSCQHLLELRLRGKIEKLKLPPRSGLPQRLEMLTLEGSKLEEDPMPTLERLPNLRILCLLYRSYEGRKMVCAAGGFRQLEHLELHDLTELEEWQVEEGAMPIIRTLKMYACPELKLLPEKLKSVIIS